MTTVTFRTVSRPITEHPEFRTPRNDWRVRKAYWTEKYEDEDGNLVLPEFIPEDRSLYNPAEDGMSLADFFDFERGEFKPDCPPRFAGITEFLSVEKDEEAYIGVSNERHADIHAARSY